MGQAVIRIGDNCTGHDICPPVPLVTGSGNVNVNGRPVGRIGDSFQDHGCIVHTPHTPQIAAGSPKVRINGKPVGRVGDAVSCGGTIAEGSNNVFMG